MLSGDGLRAKARWYRGLAARETGLDRDKLLATAAGFDARAERRDARLAAVTVQQRLRRRLER